MADIQKLNVNNTTYDISTTWAKVTGKPSSFTPSSHTHDDRYYTESEINNKLSGKSDTGHTHSYLPLSGGDLKGTTNYNGLPDSNKLFGTNKGLIHIRNSNTNNYHGNAITWAYNDTVNAQAGIYVTTGGSYGSEMWFGTTHSFANGVYAAMKIDSGGQIHAVRNNFVGNLTGNASSAGTSTYASRLGDSNSYYTKSSLDTALAGKANSSHGTHLSGSAALYSNSTQGVNCNDATYNLIGYYVSNGPSTSLGASTNDGTLYSQSYSSSWVSQIAQDYRNGNLFTRGKNNGTWTAWKAVSYNGHTHTKSQITDFPSSLPASDVYSWAKASTKPTYTYSEVGAAAASHTHNTIVGSYTANGGQQNPNYFGVNKVGALMMNTTVNGNSQYKDWLFMDCYSGSDVGGGVAIGVNRQTLGLYIMRSEATRTSWSEKAEIIGTHNYTTYCASASHTHNYAGSSSAGGAATSVVVSDSNANSTYRMVWHSGNSLYSTDNIYCNPSADYLYSKGFYQTSDERLKTFYDPIKVDLEKLKKLRKNYFKFKDKDKLEIGVSAQEIQSIYPEIVSENSDGYLSVAYDKLSVIALAAIDELDNKYKKEINDLKDQLDAIKNILKEKGIV